MELVKFIRLILLLGIIGMILFFKDAGSFYEAIKILIYSTIIYAPLALIIKKLDLFAAGEFSKKYARGIGYLSIGLMTIITPLLPSSLQAYLFIVAYEMMINYYLYLRKLEKSKLLIEVGDLNP